MAEVRTVFTLRRRELITGKDTNETLGVQKMCFLV